MALPIEKRVDRWEIRCRFNRSGYRERINNGQLQFDLRKRKPVKPDSDLPQAYKFSIEWYYIDPQTGDELAHGHCYEYEDQSTTAHDPKHLHLNGVNYALFTGSGWLRDKIRDPASLFPMDSWCRNLYVKWRRFKCDRWGR
jgi:hypothetical protein